MNDKALRRLHEESKEVSRLCNQIELGRFRRDQALDIAEVHDNRKSWETYRNYQRRLDQLEAELYRKLADIGILGEGILDKRSTDRLGS